MLQINDQAPPYWLATRTRRHAMPGPSALPNPSAHPARSDRDLLPGSALPGHIRAPDPDLRPTRCGPPASRRATTIPLPAGQLLAHTYAWTDIGDRLGISRQAARQRWNEGPAEHATCQDPPGDGARPGQAPPARTDLGLTAVALFCPHLTVQHTCKIYRSTAVTTGYQRAERATDRRLK
jgi:hypothetical protein